MIPETFSSIADPPYQPHGPAGANRGVRICVWPNLRVPVLAPHAGYLLNSPRRMTATISCSKYKLGDVIVLGIGESAARVATGGAARGEGMNRAAIAENAGNAENTDNIRE